MQIAGHRGAAHEWPENTLLGIQKAIDCGLHAVEIDVHKSKDGRLMVIHDPSLERTTNGKGPVNANESQELRKLDAGKNEKIPFLEEVLELSIKNKIHLFIEAKAFDIKNELQQIINSMNAYEHCTVICFRHDFILDLKNIDSQIQIGCLTSSAPIDPVTMVKNASASLLAISISTIHEKLVQLCHEKNIQVAVWNANTKEEFERVQKLNVDFIMTDRPSLVHEWQS